MADLKAWALRVIAGENGGPKLGLVDWIEGFDPSMIASGDWSEDRFSVYDSFGRKIAVFERE